MISLDLTKSSEVRKAGDRSKGASINHVDTKGGRRGQPNVYVCLHGGRGGQSTVYVDNIIPF